MSHKEEWPSAFAPHCDQRILHAPGECKYCDDFDEWQEARELWGIAYTGHTPTDGQIPCPADVARPPGSESDHRRWGGNVAKPQVARCEAMWSNDNQCIKDAGHWPESQHLSAKGGWWPADPTDHREKPEPEPKKLPWLIRHLANGFFHANALGVEVQNWVDFLDFAVVLSLIVGLLFAVLWAL